jgi:anti-anti-sigma factor
MSGVEYISSAGLRQIVSAYKLMRGKLTLSNVSAEALHVFQMAGFDKRLNIV